MTTPPPPIHNPEVRQLNPRMITLWRLSTALSTLFWVVAILLASAFIPLPVSLGPLAALMAASGVISILFYAPARWRAWTFEVGPHDVRLRHGVHWRTESVVPHVRIQHVDTSHGPIERWLGLASVIIFTAGSVGGALAIPGLDLAEAETLRDHLAALSGSDDAV